jgi:uncharacterized membrane protein YkvA (DUF1232 family)
MENTMFVNMETTRDKLRKLWVKIEKRMKSQAVVYLAERKRIREEQLIKESR